MEMRDWADQDDDWSGHISRKPNFKIMALALALILPLGYTLAANINIGSSSPLEFGQGIVVATSCDDHIRITPTSNFSNWENDFHLRELAFSDVANECIGKSFEIGLYTETGSVLANPYGPLVIHFSDDVPSNIHFELDSKNTTIATFKSGVIDTATAGFGTNGNSKYLGASSFALNYIVKDDFMPFFARQASRITFQTHMPSSYASFAMSDPFTNACSSLVSTDTTGLESFMDASNKKAQAMSDLVDLSLALHDEYLGLSSLEKTRRASEYQRFAETGLRLTSFIAPELTQCVNRIQGYIQAENVNYRWSLQSASRDAILAAMDMNDDATVALQALRTAAQANL